jgi:hypothetical protein
MASVYDIAYAAKLAGTKTTTVLYPELLSSRLRNAIIRALTQGYAQGHGDAATLADHIAMSRGLRLERRYPHIAYTRGTISEQDHATFKGMVMADWAEFVMEHPRYAPYAQQQHDSRIIGIDTYGHRQIVEFRYRRNLTRALKFMAKLVPPTPPSEAMQALIADFEANTPFVVAEYRG